MWMDLEMIILEVSQKERQRPHDTTYMWNLILVYVLPKRALYVESKIR